MKRLVLTFLFITACAKAPDAAQSQASPLQKAWTRWGTPAWTANLSSTAIGVPSHMTWIYEKGIGGTCQSDITLTETTATSGTAVTSNSIALITVSGDPPCSMFDQNWTWTLSNGVLTLCGNLNASCLDFE